MTAKKPVRGRKALPDNLKRKQRAYYLNAAETRQMDEHFKKIRGK